MSLLTAKFARNMLAKSAAENPDTEAGLGLTAKLDVHGRQFAASWLEHLLA